MWCSCIANALETKRLLKSRHCIWLAMFVAVANQPQVTTFALTLYKANAAGERIANHQTNAK
jgi:hypothetical protein